MLQRSNIILTWFALLAASGPILEKHCGALAGPVSGAAVDNVHQMHAFLANSNLADPGDAGFSRSRRMFGHRVLQVIVLESTVTEVQGPTSMPVLKGGEHGERGASKLRLLTIDH